MVGGSLAGEPDVATSRDGGRVYARASAHGRLAELVDDFWVQEAPPDPEPAQATVLAPGPSVELIVCFGDPFELLEGDTATELPPLHVVGPRTRAMRVRATGRTGMVIARLYSWMAGALVERSAAALVDRYLELGAAVQASDRAKIVARVDAARGPRAKIEVVARWLEGLLDGRSADPLVASAVRRINESAGGTPVADLAHGLCISDRQLRRRFRDSTGLGPKRFSRLVRFQKAVGLLRAGGSWREVVERCGFYDQAHLIGETTAMAGLTPRTVQGRGSTPLGRYFNGDVHELHGTAYV